MPSPRSCRVTPGKHRFLQRFRVSSVRRARHDPEAASNSRGSCRKPPTVGWVMPCSCADCSTSQRPDLRSRLRRLGFAGVVGAPGPGMLNNSNRMGESAPSWSLARSTALLAIRVRLMRPSSVSGLRLPLDFGMLASDIDDSITGWFMSRHQASGLTGPARLWCFWPHSLLF
jgi:hypothetical protein